MTYVQYWGTGVGGKLIECCGDRAVVILDGRKSMSNLNADAVEMNGFRRPIFRAYQIRRGDSFNRSHPLTGVISL